MMGMAMVVPGIVAVFLVDPAVRGRAGGSPVPGGPSAYPFQAQRKTFHERGPHSAFPEAPISWWFPSDPPGSPEREPVSSGQGQGEDDRAGAASYLQEWRRQQQASSSSPPRHTSHLQEWRSAQQSDASRR